VCACECEYGCGSEKVGAYVCVGGMCVCVSKVVHIESLNIKKYEELFAYKPLFIILLFINLFMVELYLKFTPLNDIRVILKFIIKLFFTKYKKNMSCFFN